MSTNETWVYVAADPKQPGAAFAITVGDGQYITEMYKTLADWAKRGGVPTRVTKAEGVEMLSKWVRPKKRVLAQKAPA